MTFGHWLQCFFLKLHTKIGSSKKHSNNDGNVITLEAADPFPGFQGIKLYCSTVQQISTLEGINTQWCLLFKYDSQKH